jgi:hypothetical protein
MDRLLTFKRTQIPSKSKVQRHVWQDATKLFEEGKYHESLIGLFNYVDKDLVAKRGNADKTEFNVPHGSVIVNIKIENEHVKVTVPFLKMPEKNTIPLLRRIAEINFSPLNLATIVLEGDELQFRYSTELKLCEPWKMYYVFREICINADNYDDEFIEKFGAGRLREPKVEYFSEEKQNEIWNTYQGMLSESAQYGEFFENKRLPGFVWDVLLQLFFNIDYLIAPQGALRTKLENAVSYMQNKNYSLQQKIDKGKALFKELQGISKEELCSNLYLSDLFIPIKNTASHENVKETFQKQYETAKKEMGHNDYMGAALSIRYVFLYEFYYSYAPDDIVETITSALEKSSGQPWYDAANILWAAMEQIMSGQSTQSGGASSSWGSSSSSGSGSSTWGNSSSSGWGK